MHAPLLNVSPSTGACHVRGVRHIHTLQAWNSQKPHVCGILPRSECARQQISQQLPVTPRAASRNGRCIVACQAAAESHGSLGESAAPTTPAKLTMMVGGKEVKTWLPQCMPVLIACCQMFVLVGVVYKTGCVSSDAQDCSVICSWFLKLARSAVKQTGL